MIPMTETPLPLFDQLFAGPPVTGLQNKEEALLRVQRKEAARLYRDRLIEALKVFPVRSLITIEQLRGIVGDPPEGVHYNVQGSIVNYMAKRGLIEKTGRMIQAQRPGMNATELTCWRVVKYQRPKIP